MSRFSASMEGGRFLIRFDDAKMNLLSSEALLELEQMLQPLSGDRSGGSNAAELKIVILSSGRPSLFAAGADMEQMSWFNHAEAREFSLLGQRLFDTISNLQVPTVALIDGDCFGGALDLSLAFDVRIATMRSRFAHPGARIGIVTGFGGTVRLPRQLQRAAVSRLLMANEVLSAMEAHSAGLVDAIVETFDGTSHPLIDSLEQSDRDAVLVTRILSRQSHLNAAQLHHLAVRTGELYSLRGSNGRH